MIYCPRDSDRSCVLDLTVVFSRCYVVISPREQKDGAGREESDVLCHPLGRHRAVVKMYDETMSFTQEDQHGGGR